MTAGSRPNLGGLFNGSTPPERSGNTSGAFGPRFLKQLPAEEPVRDAPGEPAPTNDVDSSAERSDRRDSPNWIDPIRLVEQYFAFLQTLLDTNRKFAVALTSSVMSLPKRGGPR